MQTRLLQKKHNAKIELMTGMFFIAFFTNNISFTTTDEPVSDYGTDYGGCPGGL